jgi:hypothetical protein
MFNTKHRLPGRTSAGTGVALVRSTGIVAAEIFSVVARLGND